MRNIFSLTVPFVKTLRKLVPEDTKRFRELQEWEATHFTRCAAITFTC